MTPQCKAKTKSGKPCRGRAQAGSDYCGPHQPASKSAAAREIQSRGPSVDGKLSKEGKREIRRLLKSGMTGPGKSVVYVIESADGVPGVKIGCAQNLQNRLHQLQIARPDPLRVAGVIVPTNGNAYALEQAAHVVARRYWMRNEWFNLSAKSALEAVRIADGAIAAGGSLHQIAERLASRVLSDDLRAAADRVNADRRKAAAR